MLFTSGTLVRMIDVRNLTKKYGDKTAVEDLTFSVKPGVVTGFLGPNGAGKSTTMRMILGLDNPTSGEAAIEGKPFAQHEDPAKVAGALIDPTWNHPGRSARSHLRAQAAYGGIPASRVDEVLHMVGLQEVASKRVGGFSLGMRQRLGLAAAMLGDPKVLLFDEPVNGLDPEGILWVRNFMKARSREGRTVLVSSHLLSEMALTAEDLIVIGKGRLRAQTSVRELIDSQEATVIVRSPHADEFAATLREEDLDAQPTGQENQLAIKSNAIEHVGDIAASYGFTLHELRLDRPTLEQAFMSLTQDDVEYRTDPIADDSSGLEDVVGGVPGTPGQPGHFQSNPGQPGNPGNSVPQSQQFPQQGGQR